MAPSVCRRQPPIFLFLPWTEDTLSLDATYSNVDHSPVSAGSPWHRTYQEQAGGKAANALVDLKRGVWVQICCLE